MLNIKILDLISGETRVCNYQEPDRFILDYLDMRDKINKGERSRITGYTSCSMIIAGEKEDSFIQQCECPGNYDITVYEEELKKLVLRHFSAINAVAVAISQSNNHTESVIVISVHGKIVAKLKNGLCFS